MSADSTSIDATRREPGRRAAAQATRPTTRSATGQAAKRAASTFNKGRFIDLFKRATRVVLVLTVLLGLAVVGARVWHYFLSPHHFPVNTVTVEGDFQYIDRAAVQKAVVGYSNQGFFAMQVDALHAEMLTISWVASAAIQRVWPDAISLILREHKPIARWNDKSLLTASGVLITPPQLSSESANLTAWRGHFKSLPLLRGEAGKSSLLWQRFAQASKALHGVGVGLHGIQNDRRNAVTLFLDNGISVRLGRDLGHGWFDRHINRLATVYSTYIAPRLGDISYVDLRYPNGFAMGLAGG